MKRSASFHLQSPALGVGLLLSLFAAPTLISQEPPTPGIEVTLSLRVHGPAGQPDAVQAEGTAKWFGKEKVEPVAFKTEAGSPATPTLRPGRAGGAAGLWAPRGGRTQLLGGSTAVGAWGQTGPGDPRPLARRCSRRRL